ncbi:MAG: hypothetical protein HC935_07765, partial [Pseudanabaena sp. SU_2_4]|nr:hypothetical protein [Pseudanabaena sp. SU_2_4]
DPFLGGRGSERFMNVALNTPPNGVLPAITFGAIAMFQVGDVGLSLWSSILTIAGARG